MAFQQAGAEAGPTLNRTLAGHMIFVGPGSVPAYIDIDWPKPSIDNPTLRAGLLFVLEALANIDPPYHNLWDIIKLSGCVLPPHEVVWMRVFGCVSTEFSAAWMQRRISVTHCLSVKRVCAAPGAHLSGTKRRGHPNHRRLKAERQLSYKSS